MDWCRRDQLEKVTDIDEINEYKITKNDYLFLMNKYICHRLFL